MKTQLTPTLDAIFVNEKNCCKALEILAVKHGLDADHAYVQELQELMNEGAEDFVVFLCNRVA
tara:strand:- start:138 stop:326 length:189 start_codon:yes stop_codon:yes gene_type:complete